MADIKSPAERYKAIADAIREKNGTTGLLSPADMPQAILDIESGGIEAIDHTVTFMVENEPYEVVSVKDGNVINAPTQPKVDGVVFTQWELNNGIVSFPYLPTTDCEINAIFSSLVKGIYDVYNVDKTTYPYIAVVVQSLSIYTYFSKNGFPQAYYSNGTIRPGEMSYTPSKSRYYINKADFTGSDTNFTDVAQYIINYGFVSPDGNGLLTPIGTVFTNYDMSAVTTNFIQIS